MKKTTFSKFAIDNASILFLALIRKDHTNTFRFTMTLREPICPDTLQMAVDRVFRRFPTVIAGFQAGFFHYVQVPAKAPPQVQQDPGCLHTMTKDEIRNCAYRVYYLGNQIIIEAFHALTDGYGAIASFATLVAEYLRLKHGIHIPAGQTIIDLEDSPMLHELEDSFLDYEQGNPYHLPGRFSYRIPGGSAARDTIHTNRFTIPTQPLLETARSHGVSITTMLSSLMAASIMELQTKQTGAPAYPVRIMVPVDLRRMFPSRTLRNFVLYTLPTMEPHDARKPLGELLRSFSTQMKAQMEASKMASIMAYNVRLQRSWYFQIIPLAVKCALMRLIYRFFGDSNSSVTVTNLGNVQLPQEMDPFVDDFNVILTPRMRSPYNCSVISYKGLLSINISRFPQESELEEIFYRKLYEALNSEGF